MKITKSSFILLLVLFTSFALYSEDSEPVIIGDVEMNEVTHSTAFKQMEKMLGLWEGKLTQFSGNVIDVSSNFRLVSGGNTITEYIIEDGVEMLTTYTDQDGTLVVKHYCALGTQPVFKVTEVTDQSLKVGLDAKVSNYHPEHHSYVNSMNWKMDSKNADSVIVDTTLYIDGQLQEQRTEIQRVN